MHSYLSRAATSGWLFMTDISDVVGVVFRDHQAAAAALQYHSYLDSAMRSTFLQLFLLMLEANPQNKKHVTRCNMTEALLSMAMSCPTSELEKLYLDLMTAMYSYDFQEEQARMVLEVAYDPEASYRRLRRTKDSPTTSFIDDPPERGLPAGEAELELSVESVRLLALTLLRRVSQNSGPLSFFSLNGTTSFISCALERFPSSKVGYTFFCWFNITAFLEKETGLFCLEDSAGAVIFEIFFKGFGGEGKQCIGIRTHNRPSPPEDGVFDTGSSIVPGTWHMITFVHRKQMATMYLDGALLQSTSTFNYPKPSKLFSLEFVPPTAHLPSRCLIRRSQGQGLHWGVREEAEEHRGAPFPPGATA